MTEQIIIDILYFLLHDVFQWLSYFVILTYMLTPKFSRFYIVAVPFAIAFCKPIYSLLNSKFVSPFILFGLMTVTVLISFKEKKIICLAAMAVSQLTLVFLSLVSSLTIHNILGYYPTEIHPYKWSSIIYTIALDLLVWIAFSFMLPGWNKLLKRKNVKSLGYFWLFPVGQVIFFWACLFHASQDMENYLLTNPYLMLAVAVSLLSDILMYRALRENSHVQDMKQTISQLEKEMELQLKYYDSLAEQYNEIREYKHDIRNMVAAAKALAVSGRGEAEQNSLIDDMEQRADRLSVPIYCADSLVNAVLWQKSMEAEKSGIHFSVLIDKSERFDIERIDICSLLVNLLDNAIYEAAKTEGGSVSIAFSRRAGLLFIETSNSTEAVIARNSPIPKIEKPGDHGHGSEIIEKIVSKYSGSYSLTADGTSARAVVSLIDGR